MNLVEQTVHYLDRTSNKIAFKKDGYGSHSKVTSNIFWEREDWDDGSFIVHQLDRGVLDRTLKFGPLSAKLSELYAKGFILTIESFTHRRKHSLILRNSNNYREYYKVATVTNDDLSKVDDLTRFIRDGSKPDYHVTQANIAKPQEIIKIVEKEVIKEVMIESDPLDQLLMRYPLKRKPVEFIGNLTLDEYVKQQLKENRKLHYVE
jgi:hypothetical protein